MTVSFAEGVVLGVGTSGSRGSVALLGPGEAVRRESLDTGLIHGVALAPAVRTLLDEADLRATELLAVAVDVGPGSYTGVRVGVAFVKGLALAARIPVVGVPSLLAMAAAVPAGETVVCARDGRRETLYLAVYERRAGSTEVVRPPELVPHDRVGGRLPESALVIGDAVERFPDLLSGGRRRLAGSDYAEADAVRVAELGRVELDRRGPDEVHDLAPVYLRPTEAEERRERDEGMR